MRGALVTLDAFAAVARGPGPGWRDRRGAHRRRRPMSEGAAIWDAAYERGANR